MHHQPTKSRQANMNTIQQNPYQKNKRKKKLRQQVDTNEGLFVSSAYQSAEKTSPTRKRNRNMPNTMMPQSPSQSDDLSLVNLNLNNLDQMNEEGKLDVITDRQEQSIISNAYADSTVKRRRENSNSNSDQIESQMSAGNYAIYENQNKIGKNAGGKRFRKGPSNNSIEYTSDPNQIPLKQSSSIRYPKNDRYRVNPGKLSRDNSNSQINTTEMGLITQTDGNIETQERHFQEIESQEDESSSVLSEFQNDQRDHSPQNNLGRQRKRQSVGIDRLNNDSKEQNKFRAQGSYKMGLKKGQTSRQLQSEVKQDILGQLDQKMVQSLLQNNIKKDIKSIVSDIYHKTEKKLDVSNQKSDFIEQYGVFIEFPAYYYHQARFVPHYKDYVMTLSFHIVPEQPTVKIQTSYLDGTIMEHTYNEVYKKKKGMILTLSVTNGRRGFTELKQVQLSDIDEAVMEFSSTGKYFGMIKIPQQKHQQKHNVLQVYDSTDISDCLSQLMSRKGAFKREIDFQQFGTATRVVFDYEERYVAFVSRNSIIIFSLEDEDYKHEYKIDFEKYDEILDVVIKSQNTNNGDMFHSMLVCYIACKLNCQNIVQIFDIFNQEQKKAISYMKRSENLFVKIALNLKTVIMSNGYEHYLHNGRNQQNIPWLKDKFIRFAIDQDSEFFLVTSKDYDRDIDILSTSDEYFNASISRSSEPGSLKIEDALIWQENGRTYLKTLSLNSDYLHSDTIDKSMGNNHDPMSAVIGTSSEKQYSCYGFSWPYFCYATKNNKILILNAFNKELIQRQSLPQMVGNVVHSFITDTNDLFLICETINQTVAMFQINLDTQNPQVEGPLLEYDFYEVDSAQLNSFHVRSSSVKERINLNKNLFAFMLHGTKLVVWRGIEGMSIEVVDDNVHNFTFENDEVIYYMRTVDITHHQNQVKHSTIIQLQILFGSFKKTQIYVDRDPMAEILNFGIDNTKRRVIILSGIKNSKNKRDKFITIYDIDTETIMCQIRVTSREIIGRLKSNLYNFVGGHIYYGNKVIKIRYDILEQKDPGEVTEHKIFDHYSDILKIRNRMSSTITVQSGTPLQTNLYNRLAYIIRNQQDLRQREILILPYLHERKIILNRRHQDNQFYTLFEHNWQQYIICFCFSLSKLYIYNEVGILVGRVVYDHITEECGKPVILSEDAKYFIFRQGSSRKEIYLIKLTIEGLQKEKEFDLREMISNHIIRNKSCSKNISQIHEFWMEYLDKLNHPELVDMQFQMNDCGDVLVRLKPNAIKKVEIHSKYKEKNPEAKMFDENCSLFFFIPNKDIILKHHYLFFDNNSYEGMSNIQGISINERFCFLWNKNQIWQLNLTSKKFKKLPLHMSLHDQYSSIKTVRCGSNKNLICVRIKQTPTIDCMIVWDLQKDLEQNQFDISHDAMFFQDQLGNPFLAQKDYIINCIHGCKLKAYNVKVTDFDQDNVQFSFETGHRVQVHTHNFVIFRNYLNMSHSYMTFVIKDNFYKRGYLSGEYFFDLEGYDYIINKKNIFFDLDLISQQYDRLNFILNNYYMIDPILLETLHYMNEETQKIPLHMALEANNTRMVNLVLNYMSKIDYSAVRLIENIFKDLVKYKNFQLYLTDSPFQTHQMMGKQTLRLQKSEDHEILTIASNSQSYVDECFYKDKMLEEPEGSDCKTYATTILCVQVDWIMNDQSEDLVGQQFLKELLKNKNKDLFMTSYVQIIVRFLFKQFRDSILKVLLPFYVIHFLINLYMITFQSQIDSEQAFSEDLDDQIQAQAQKKVLLVLSLLITSYNLYIFVRQTIRLKLLAFKRFWSFIDCIIITSNFILCSQLFVNLDRIIERFVEAICIIFMMSKSLYFFRLIGEIAPLVDIIAVIFNDILYFMVIYAVALTGFITAFYLIGRNQEEIELQGLDAMSRLAYEPPQYSSFIGAIVHVYLSSLGEFDVGRYLGHQMQYPLLLLFFTLSFFMCIHMLNMLIAIMGNSFDANNKEKAANKTIFQLQFVVENWWIDPIQNKEDIVYLIAAFDIQDKQEPDEEKFEKLNDRIDQLQQTVGNLMLMMKHSQLQNQKIQANLQVRV